MDIGNHFFKFQLTPKKRPNHPVFENLFVGRLSRVEMKILCIGFGQMFPKLNVISYFISLRF